MATQFSNDEMNLMCIYNPDNGTRSALIAELKHMLPFLDKDEAELRALTEGTVAKLQRITDKEFAAVQMYPDFDREA